MTADSPTLPKGWEPSTIREATVLVTRGTAPSYVAESPVSAIGQRCVQNSGFDVNATRPHDPKLMKVSVEPAAGDVLLNSTGTGTIGRSCIFDKAAGRFVIDSHITLLRARNSILESKFLLALLQSARAQRFLESYCYSGSTNQVELVGSRLEGMVIPLPSVREQRRIAEIVDASDELISQTEAVIAKRLAVGLALSSLAWEENTGWLPLAEVATVESGLTLGSEPSGASSVELPYLRVANVQDGHIDTTEMKTVRVLRSQVARYSVVSGDVLLTEGGDFDKLGRGAVWDGRIEPCLHQNHIFRIRCRRDLIIPEYLALYTASPFGRRYFLSVAKQTTNLASINSTQLKAMPIPLPTLDEQEGMLRGVRATRSVVAAEHALLEKLRMVKKGLMDDLLTGRVRVGEFVR